MANELTFMPVLGYARHFYFVLYEEETRQISQEKTSRILIERNPPRISLEILQDPSDFSCFMLIIFSLFLEQIDDSSFKESIIQALEHSQGP
jgi:hypothetical protein